MDYIRFGLFPKEDTYFRQNLDVAGMVSDDNKIIMNPYTTLSDKERKAVIRNESARLYMKLNNIVPDFKVTKEQLNQFKGTPYGSDFNALKQTIVGRIISGDPSVTPTEAQKQYVDSMKGRFNNFFKEVGY